MCSHGQHLGPNGGAGAGGREDQRNPDPGPGLSSGERAGQKRKEAFSWGARGKCRERPRGERGRPWQGAVAGDSVFHHAQQRATLSASAQPR